MSTVPLVLGKLRRRTVSRTGQLMYIVEYAANAVEASAKTETITNASAINFFHTMNLLSIFICK